MKTLSLLFFSLTAFAQPKVNCVAYWYPFNDGRDGHENLEQVGEEQKYVYHTKLFDYRVQELDLQNGAWELEIRAAGSSSEYLAGAVTHFSESSQSALSLNAKHQKGFASLYCFLLENRANR